MAAYMEIKREIEGLAVVRDAVRVIERISSVHIAKLRDANERLAAYTSGIEDLIREIASDTSLEHPLFLGKETDKPAAVLVITSDKGLVGGYNHGVIQLALSLSPDEHEFFVIGRKGREAFDKAGRSYQRAFDGLPDVPSESESRTIEEILVSGFLEGHFRAVLVIYTHFASLSSLDSTIEVFLPFEAHPRLREPLKISRLPIFEPRIVDVADYLTREYVSLEFFRIAVDAKLAEIAARTVATGAAGDRAEDIISHLTTAYHRRRREEITASINVLFAAGRSAEVRT